VEFTSLGGERVHLSDFQGQPVLVTFWASDCRSCIQEMPDLEALHRDYGARGLQILAVAMAYDPPNLVVELTRARHTPYRVILDPQGVIADAFGGVTLVPNSFLIGPEGTIVRHALGRLQADSWRADIERMLGGT
jgi:peroxiredoxin